jgi:ABC-2 type transport system ATP-binding protein
VLLLDEPAAALDPIGRNDVLQLMERLRGDTTIFYSTHILADVQRVSDHVAILDRGRLVVSSPTDDLLRHLASGSLAVVLIGATEETGTALAGLTGVTDVRVTSRTGNEWHSRSTWQSPLGSTARPVSLPSRSPSSGRPT